MEAGNLVPVRKVAAGGTTGLVAYVALRVVELAGYQVSPAVSELVVYAVTIVVAYFTRSDPLRDRSRGRT